MGKLFDIIVNKKNTLPQFDVDKTKYYHDEEGNIIVFLSIDHGFTQSYVVTGKGTDFTTAVNIAVNNYKKELSESSRAISVKLDIVTEINPVLKESSRIDVHKDKISYRRNIDGLIFNQEPSLAFLPEEVRSYKMIQNRIIQPSNIFNAFEKHFLLTNQKLVKNFLASKYQYVHKFRTDSWFIDFKEFIEIYRGSRQYNNLNQDNLKYSIELTKDNYFKQCVNSQGKFVYSYNPEDSEIPNTYNILRHAGTVYSMIETYELFPDKGLMNAIERAIKYLINRIQHINVNDKEAQVVVERNSIKLGGNGLTLVALAKYTQVTGDEQYLSLMQNMATWIAEHQNDNGEFIKHIQNFDSRKSTGFVSRFYPGEAILALCRLYKVDKNEYWLDIAEKAAQFLITERDAGATVDTITPDHWLLYALNDLHRERPKEIYLNHVLFMSESIIKYQNLNPATSRPELRGSFKKSKASTEAACKSEGLGAAYRLAKDYGHEVEAEKFKNTINEFIKFQLQLQFKPESVMYLRNKKFCLGAFQQGLNNLEIRNDYTQHNISSIISYYNILKEY